MIYDGLKDNANISSINKQFSNKGLFVKQTVCSFPLLHVLLIKDTSSK
jgi:hypothetical protein